MLNPRLHLERRLDLLSRAKEQLQDLQRYFMALRVHIAKALGRGLERDR